jgi:hypothetical protein
MENEPRWSIIREKMIDIRVKPEKTHDFKSLECVNYGKCRFLNGGSRFCFARIVRGRVRLPAKNARARGI